MQDVFCASYCKALKIEYMCITLTCETVCYNVGRSNGSVVEHSSREQEVMGSIPDRVIRKTLYKLVPDVPLLKHSAYKDSSGFSVFSNHVQK